MATAHIVPLDDLIGHEEDECPCGPDIEYVIGMDGASGKVIVHHSLDGREMREKPRT